MQEKNKENWLNSRLRRRSSLTSEQLLPKILAGDVTALSSGITLIESKNERDQSEARSLVEACLPHSGKSIRIGITGVPGVGKSTFIESYGQLLVKKGRKVAILAIDPSSAVSGGSILGDKTRMNQLSAMDEVFIRPSPAGETLGGVARKTRESILLCEAAGFDYIIIETVGVGQSETTVKSMVDFFLLLMLSGAGDELQGIKKGIMEMADSVVITKADGDNIHRSKLAAREYKNALHLFPANQNEWIPKVLTCSALTGHNLDEVYEMILSFENHMKVKGHLEELRKTQDVQWFKESVKELVLNTFYSDSKVDKNIPLLINQVKNGEVSSFKAAQQLFELYNTKE